MLPFLIRYFVPQVIQLQSLMRVRILDITGAMALLPKSPTLLIRETLLLQFLICAGCYSKDTISVSLLPAPPPEILGDTGISSILNIT